MADIGDDVLEVLSRAACEGDSLVLPEQLDRKLYVAVDKVLGALGGAWNRKRRAHVFGGEAFAAIEPALLTGSYVDEKKEFDAFPTPATLAADIVGRAQIDPRHIVLEPSAGAGALLIPIRRCASNVVAIEKNAKAAALLQEQGFNVVCDDFLAVAPRYDPDARHSLMGKFDRIVMNPPFSRGADARHIMHALKFLRPGGRLIAIASAGARFRQDGPYRELRATLGEYGAKAKDRRLDTVIADLPEGSFKESGTMVNTIVITVDKPSLVDDEA